MYIFGNFKGDFAENIRKNADRQKIESNFDMKNIELSIRYEKISRLIEFFDYRTSLMELRLWKYFFIWKGVIPGTGY